MRSRAAPNQVVCPPIGLPPSTAQQRRRSNERGAQSSARNSVRARTPQPHDEARAKKPELNATIFANARPKSRVPTTLELPRSRPALVRDRELRRDVARANARHRGCHAGPAPEARRCATNHCSRAKWTRDPEQPRIKSCVPRLGSPSGSIHREHRVRWSHARHMKPRDEVSATRASREARGEEAGAERNDFAKAAPSRESNDAAQSYRAGDQRRNNASRADLVLEANRSATNPPARFPFPRRSDARGRYGGAAPNRRKTRAAPIEVIRRRGAPQ